MRALIDRTTAYSQIFLRLALGIGFLSSVADRFGLWGPAGSKNVAWGNFTNFLAFTALLNPYIPRPAIPVLGWVVTLFETCLGLLLIVGFRLKATAMVASLLLLLFAIGMAIGLGIKVPFDYSVLAASTGALLLAAQRESTLSIDSLLVDSSANAHEVIEGTEPRSELLCP